MSFLSNIPRITCVTIFEDAFNIAIKRNFSAVNFLKVILLLYRDFKYLLLQLPDNKVSNWCVFLGIENKSQRSDHKLSEGGTRR